MMKNRYALNELGDLIDVKDVDKSKKEKFFCCSCNKIMIARKGLIKEHHFTHKQKNECNFETYLHKVSKLIFYNVYKSCLANQIPFYIKFDSVHICYSCWKIKELNFLCREAKSTKFDLTKIFDKIDLEKKVDNWIPDILLSSTKMKSEKLFFEIVVTHKCESRKIDSGFRIIEKFVKDETSLYDIFQRELDLQNNHYTTYNFKNKILGIQSKDCIKSFYSFRVDLNGREPTLETVTITELYDYIHRGFYVSIVDKDLYNEYLNEPNSYLKRTIYYKIRELEVEKYLENHSFKDIINCRFGWVGYQYKKYPYYVCNKVNEKLDIKKCYKCPFHWRKTEEDYRKGQIKKRNHYVWLRSYLSDK